MALELEDLLRPNRVAAVAERLRFAKPRLAAKVGDRVKVGSLLFTDKRRPELQFRSPGGGTVGVAFFRELLGSGKLFGHPVVPEAFYQAGYANNGLNSVFVGNILLSYFLGMCSFLAVSRDLQTAAGLGVAVTFVMALTTPVNWLIYRLLLAPGALAWAGLPNFNLNFLKLILFIAQIAAIVQIIDRYSPALYTALGVYLPLITVNCALLGALLFMVERSRRICASASRTRSSVSRNTRPRWFRTKTWRPSSKS